VPSDPNSNAIHKKVARISGMLARDGPLPKELLFGRGISDDIARAGDLEETSGGCHSLLRLEHDDI
jgi:hypothetical protein